ncbi:hypothetical protein ACFQQE_00145 [Glycomyces mayteni]|uniref:hypothetical protein n=1 Tax=Glycomyces mayteni TaxID=543887 RepID=UPI003612F7AD
MEVGPEAKAQIDAAAAAATAVDADAPQKVAASKTELHTGEVSGDGAIGGMTGGEVNQTFIDSIRIERNEAADHIRGSSDPLPIRSPQKSQSRTSFPSPAPKHTSNPSTKRAS